MGERVLDGVKMGNETLKQIFKNFGWKKVIEQGLFPKEICDRVESIPSKEDSTSYRYELFALNGVFAIAEYEAPPK